MSRPLSIVATLIGLAIGLSGCTIAVPTDADVLVLEYALTPPPGDEGAASPGNHCRVASIEDDILYVQRHEHEEAGGSGRFLFVDPEFTEPVPTLGTNPLVLGLPAQVHAGISGIPDPWATIDIDDGGVVSVDGKDVSLPHGWEAQQDGWRIVATLQEGPSQVKVTKDQMCM